MSEFSGRAEVVLSGYGPVGRSFVEHLSRERDALARRYGVRLGVAAVRASATQCLLRDGEPVPARSAWGPLMSLGDTLDRTGARVFAQAVPSSPQLREQAAAEALIALSRGVHVVTATKSHLLSHWRQLDETARAHDRAIGVSGATGAALPAGDLARSGLRGLGCDVIRACPNGTVTFVLDRLAEGGSLRETEPGDPLYALNGPEKAVVFGCPDAGDVVVSGGRSSPLGAALAMVKDTLEVTARRVGFA